MEPNTKAKSELNVILGQRLRARRNELGYTQLYTSEKADVHPTYIGQLERGERNVTVTNLVKICCALELPLDILFANINLTKSNQKITQNAQKCYDLVISQPVQEQEKLYLMLENIVKYKQT